jgi:hypothetical protein
VFAPPDGIQSGFNGDYSSLTIDSTGPGSSGRITGHPIWSGTRNIDPFAPANGVTHDEDLFTDNVLIPNGKLAPGPGTIGQY